MRVNCGPPAQEDLGLSTFYPAKLSMVLAWVLVPVAIDRYWRGRWALPSLTDLLMKYLFCPCICQEISELQGYAVKNAQPLRQWETAPRRMDK